MKLRNFEFGLTKINRINITYLHFPPWNVNHILFQLNIFHTLIFCSFKSHFNIILSSTLRFQVV
jgi:hypothetical protein